MSADPYAYAAALAERLERAAGGPSAVLERSDALARQSDRDELRDLVDELADAARSFAALLDWVEESSLPPGLRAALDRPGVHELGVDPASGQARVVGSNPLEAGEPLAALVHTAEMGEAYDRARLDVADIGAGENYDPANPAHRDRPYRFRVRAIADELDAELGPLEHASLYLDAAGARRLAAALRLRVDTAEGPGGHR